MTNESIEKVLKGIVHPETGENIVDSGFVERAEAGTEGNISVTLRFAKTRDPFAEKIRRHVEEALSTAFPQSRTMVIVKEAAPKRAVANNPPPQHAYATSSP